MCFLFKTMLVISKYPHFPRQSASMDSKLIASSMVEMKGYLCGQGERIIKNSLSNYLKQSRSTEDNKQNLHNAGLLYKNVVCNFLKNFVSILLIL